MRIKYSSPTGSSRCIYLVPCTGLEDHVHPTLRRDQLPRAARPFFALLLRRLLVLPPAAGPPPARRSYICKTQKLRSALHESQCHCRGVPDRGQLAAGTVPRTHRQPSGGAVAGRPGPCGRCRPSRPRPVGHPPADLPAGGAVGPVQHGCDLVGWAERLSDADLSAIGRNGNRRPVRGGQEGEEIKQ